MDKYLVIRTVWQQLNGLDMNSSQLNVLTSIKMCFLSYGDVCVLSLIRHLLAASHSVYYCTFASPIEYGPEWETTVEA